MRDTGQHRYLLRLETLWTMGHVEFDVKDQRVGVLAEYTKPKSWLRPECSVICKPHTITTKNGHGDILAFSLKYLRMRESPSVNAQATIPRAERLWRFMIHQRWQRGH